MLPGRFLVPGLLLLVACGDDGPATDAGPDDAPFVPVDIDNGSCGDQLRFTGEYIDWDSSNASFCGIFDALFQVEGDGAMDNTAPNGRFDLCVPRGDSTTLTVTQPTGNSQCTATPAPYTIPVIAVVREDFILAGGFWSGRAWTAARQASVFEEAGVTFDPTRAQVVVHFDGPTAGGATLSNASGAVRMLADTTDVFFANVEVGSGQTTLSVDGDVPGEGSIPLEAGTITLVSVKTN